MGLLQGDSKFLVTFKIKYFIILLSLSAPLFRVNSCCDHCTEAHHQDLTQANVGDLVRAWSLESQCHNSLYYTRQNLKYTSLG